jgi:hypothetical protein
MTIATLDNLPRMTRLHRQHRGCRGKGCAVAPHILPRRHVAEIPRIPVLMFEDDALIQRAIDAKRESTLQKAADAIEPSNVDRPDDWTEVANLKHEMATRIRALANPSAEREV